MTIHYCYQTFVASIALFAMINVDLTQSSALPNECLNYCSNGGACYKSNTAPKCICPSKWTGARCDIPQNGTSIGSVNATQTNVTDERNNQCTLIPPDYCLNDGICYLDTANNMFACYCRFPYTGDHCEEVSECYNYCQNNGLCELDANNLPTCTCTPEWTGILCQRLVTTTTVAPTTIITTPSVLCIQLGASYCNSGTCGLVAGRVQCFCPPMFTGNRCETPVGVTPTGPVIITPPTITTPGIRCEGDPCKNNGRCYPTGNTYYCLCSVRFTGKNCENSA